MITNYIKSKESAWETSTAFRYLFQAFLGSIFLALASQVTIPLPFTPVPFTLQSLAVLLLIVSQGKRAVYSIGLYLTQATLGLPVLAYGLVNPLWIVGPRGGYLVGFACAAYVAGHLLEKKPHSSLWCLFCLVLAKLSIYSTGALWLSFFMGWKDAILLGVVPFVGGGILKVLIATSLLKPIQWVKKGLFHN